MLPDTIWIASDPDGANFPYFDDVAIALRSALASLGGDARIVRDRAGLGELGIVLAPQLLRYQAMPPGKRLILFNLEQYSPQSFWFNAEYLGLLGHYPVWDYSPANIRALSGLGIGATHCGIGYAPQLTRIEPAEEDIDVLFYGTMTERRERLLDDVRRRGLRVHVGRLVFGDARDRLIARSKIVLNLHQFDAHVFEIVRVSYLLANRKCVVSETGHDEELEQPFRQAVAFASYDKLAQACEDLVADADARAALAQSGYECIRALPQSDYLRAALAQMENSDA